MTSIFARCLFSVSARTGSTTLEQIASRSATIRHCAGRVRVRPFEEMNAQTLFEELSCIVDGANMAIGSPSMDVLKKCPEMIAEAVSLRMNEERAESLFQYGPTQGDPRFRRALADFLSTKYGQPVTADSLVVTSGATAGLGLLMNLFFKKDDIVFVEDLSYFIALRYFREDCGLRIVPVATDNDGIIPEALERAITAHSADLRPPTSEHPFQAAIYLVPTFHNPTGRCLHPSRCARVVEIARRKDLLVVCDDVYNLMPLSVGATDPDPISPPRLLSYDDAADPNAQGNVVSNGSFSKVFGPGMRLGWLEGPKRIIGRVYKSAYIQSGGATQHLMAGIMAVVLERGFQGQLLENGRRGLEKQATALCGALDRCLPEGASYQPPLGGYFVWVTFPESIDAEELATRLLQENITLQPGVRFSADGGYKHCVRLSFSYSPPDELTKGVERMCEVVREMLN